MSKPIEGCPQPETPIRERAWTAEQVERAADDATPFSPRWAQMLRAYAATLRQQATNQPEIGSKLVGGGAVSDEVVARFVEESAQIISGAPFPSARSLAKAREISDKMLEAVAPLLRAPGGQGGVMLDFPGIGGAGPFPVVDGKVTLPDTTMSDIAHHFRAGHSLAQNAQGEAVPAFWAAVSDDGEIAIAYSADDGNSGAAARTECNQWINDHGGVFHLRPLYLHAERARVPASLCAKPIVWSGPEHAEWWDDRHGFHIGHDPDEDEPFSAAWGEGEPERFATLDEAKAWCQGEIDDWVRGTVALAAAPSQPEDADHD